MTSELLDDQQKRDIANLLLNIQSRIKSADLSKNPNGFYEAGRLIEEDIKQNSLLLRQLNETNKAILNKARDINKNTTIIDFYTQGQEIMGKVLNLMSCELLWAVPILRARYNARHKISEPISKNPETKVLSVKTEDKHTLQPKPWEISLRAHPDIECYEIGQAFETTDSNLQTILERLSGPNPFIFLRADDILDQACAILNTISAAMLLKILARYHPNIASITFYIPGFMENLGDDNYIVLLDDQQNRHVYTNNNIFHCKVSEETNNGKIAIALSAQDIMRNLIDLWSVDANIKIQAENAKQKADTSQKPGLRAKIKPIECLPRDKSINDKTRIIDAAAKEETDSLSSANLSLSDQCPDSPTIPENADRSESQNQSIAAGSLFEPSARNKPQAPLSKAASNCEPGNKPSKKEGGSYGSRLFAGVKQTANTCKQITLNAGRGLSRKLGNLFDKQSAGKQNKMPKQAERAPKVVAHTAVAAKSTHSNCEPPGHAQAQYQKYCHCTGNAMQHSGKSAKMSKKPQNPNLLVPEPSTVTNTASATRKEMPNTPIISSFRPGFRDCVRGDSLIVYVKQLMWALLMKICKFFRHSEAERYCMNNFLTQRAKAATTRQPTTQNPATETAHTIAAPLISLQDGNPRALSDSQDNPSRNIDKIEYCSTNSMASINNESERSFEPNEDLSAESEPQSTSLDKAQAITSAVQRALGV